MLPVFVAGGSKVGSGGTVTPTWPGHVADDIALLFVETSAQAASLSTPNGFVQIGSQLNIGSPNTVGAVGLAVFWKRAVSSSDANPVVADSGDHQVAQILVFRGCTVSGNPWEVNAGDTLTPASTSATIPGGVTTTFDQLVVMCVANGTDVSSDQTSAWDNTNLGNVTEITDFNSTQGKGGGFGVATGEASQPGDYGSSTATLATSSLQARLSISLRPDHAVSPSDGNSSGSADGAVTGNALWALVSAAAGFASALSLAVALTTGSGLSSGQAGGTVVGRAMWDTVAASSGVADGQTIGGGIIYGTGSIAGSAAVSGFAAKVIPGVSVSNGTGTAQSNGNAIGAATTQAGGSAAVAGVSAQFQGRTVTAQGAGDAVAFTPRIRVVYLIGAGSTAQEAYEQLKTTTDEFLLGHEEREIVFTPPQPMVDEFGVTDALRYEAHVFMYVKE